MLGLSHPLPSGPHTGFRRVAAIDALNANGSLGALEEKCAPICMYLNTWSLAGGPIWGSHDTIRG